MFPLILLNFLLDLKCKAQIILHPRTGNVFGHPESSANSLNCISFFLKQIVAVLLIYRLHRAQITSLAAEGLPLARVPLIGVHSCPVTFDKST